MRRLQEVLDTVNRRRRLKDDGEVKLLRRLQDSVRLFDAARGKFVCLSDALRPGEKLYEADLVCVGEQHDSEADHTIQRIILDAIQNRLIHEYRDDRATAAGATAPVAVGVEYFYREQNDVLDALDNAGRMVLFAGLNHVWRDAIPDRFERQSRRKGSKPLKAASVVPWHSPDTDPARLPRDADYIICMHGGGGVDQVAPVSWTNYKVAAAVSKQRARLRTRERVFPAGFV